MRETKNVLSKPAPGWCFGVDDHFDITCDICVKITITRFAIVFPTTSDVDQVELARWTSSLDHIECQGDLEIWWNWNLHSSNRKLDFMRPVLMIRSETIHIEIIADAPRLSLFSGCQRIEEGKCCSKRAGKSMVSMGGRYTYLLHHATSLPWIATRFTRCCISPKVEHEPWILLRDWQTMSENPAARGQVLLPSNREVRRRNISSRGDGSSGSMRSHDSTTTTLLHIVSAIEASS